MKRLVLLALCLSAAPTVFAADEFRLGRSRQTLVPRDEWGVLHTTPTLEEPDFAPRERWRIYYYQKSRHLLMKDPAYVGAVQEALRRNGYYCGPIDGIWNDEVVDAIARLQKAYGYRVNGYLTVSVRRALYLP